MVFCLLWTCQPFWLTHMYLNRVYNLTDTRAIGVKRMLASKGSLWGEQERAVLKCFRGTRLAFKPVVPVTLLDYPLIPPFPLSPCCNSFSCVRRLLYSGNKTGLFMTFLYSSEEISGRPAGRILNLWSNLRLWNTMIWARMLKKQQQLCEKTLWINHLLMDVEPWCYRWIGFDGLELWLGWGTEHLTVLKTL